MRLSTFLAGVSAFVVLVFLGFRLVDLEQQIARLEAKHGGAEPQAFGSTISHRANGLDTSQALEARISALEERLASRSTVTGNRGSAEAASAYSADPGRGKLLRDEAILSVVERENSRIRDVQLEFHKGRWLETRKQQLQLFAAQLRLQPTQSDELYSALENELNEMADVMRRPTFAEEPDQVAADWEKILATTDDRARTTLSPEQFAWWQQGRRFERKVLWPWLPDPAQETAQR
jgi:BMFP domain-containing protein YqiC/HAMP domain-containing protein